MTENRAKPSYAETYGAQYVGVSEGEGHFSLSYASGNMLAIAGLPFAPSRINIAYVKHLPLSGTMQTYTLDDTFINIGNGDTLELNDAQFRDGDFFEMGLKGIEAGHDTTSDARRIYSIASMPTEFDTYQEVTGSVIFDLSGSWQSGSAWQDCAGQVSSRVYVEYGFSGSAHAGANNLYLKLLETKDNTDTNKEYSEPQIVLTAGSSDIQQNLYEWTPRTFDNVTGSVHGYKEWYTYFDIDVKGAEGFKFAYSESIGAGSTTGTLSIYYTMFDQ